MLAQKVVEVLKRNHIISPAHVIEPTCGKGAFLLAAAEGFQGSKIHGYEINKKYVDAANMEILSKNLESFIEVKEADFFSIEWDNEISSMPGQLLIIGNPPWVTSSELGMLNSNNLPDKTNFQGRKGIEAITGSGNFDISEWMLLRHVSWLSNREGVIAFLCKTSVARKVMRQVRQSQEHRFFGHIYPINAKAYFDASVEACLFVLTTESGNSDCEVYESLESITPSHVIGERDGIIVSDVNTYKKWRHLKGQDSAYVWRSGLKHDCSRVMELEEVGGNYINGYGEKVDIEETYIYPLLKSSDLGNGRVNSYRKVAIVTQKNVGEDTSEIERIAPKTWEYLIRHEEYLDKRKSTIYKGKPRFSIFGIGQYSFSDWKIAISGLYKNLKFNIIPPMNGKPVVFDDTVNLIPMSNKEEAEFIYKLLVALPSTEFLSSLVFLDEKRPITTKILRELSIKEVARELGYIEKYHAFVISSQAGNLGQLSIGIAEPIASYGSRKCS
ncbi:MAG: N-6 DNA methylase [Clostridia bacterium]|nr:N-6 DNA methylase [Clostridia bacterium]